MTQASKTVAARTLWVRMLLLAVISGCAMKAAPPLPPTLKYPEFVYPAAVPAVGAQAAAVDRGWRYLQNDDLGNAEREFAAALKAIPDYVPARTGEGDIALASQDYMRALDQFELALRGAPAYAPALVGKGQALLSLNRDSEARAAFEAALKADPSLAANLGPRVDVLKFREIQDLIAAARQAMNAGRLDEARAAYLRSIAATPDSAVLYRELGMVERRQGDAAAALEQFNRAVALDPTDAVSFAQAGEILEERGDFAGAEAAYRNAANVDRFAGYDRKAEAVATRGRDASLPAEFRALASADRITRGDLAALVGIRLEELLRAAPATPVVTTDTAGHWAASWIAQAAATGVIPAFDNHTFQPGTALRRVDLAEAASALLRLMARTRPALQARLAARPTVSDMSPSHLNYPAVAAAVSAGVLPLLDDGRFDSERPVDGAEAIAAIDRLRALGESR
ncbi:MAG TPA: tetratricopeptide repeat protein [Vicinamibacterales bacterium]|nr:tetratricopeptide repeat protein [Vicinamibacterales bacterium]